MNLKKYDKILINSSGGKDSVCAMFEVCRVAKEQNYPLENIIVSHQELGESEWEGVKDLIIQQSKLFGLKTIFSKRIDKNGKEETLLEYAERRGKWPSSTQRWCTSDFKRGPGAKVLRSLCKGLDRSKILYVFGFRKSESPTRSKKRSLSLNSVVSTKLKGPKSDRHRQRTVYDWLPIHKWSDKKVWKTIHLHGLPYHWAYDVGMPRLSCCFCIMAPKSALAIAGKHNPDLLDRYIEVEEKIDHTFGYDFSLKEIREMVKNGDVPDTSENWKM